MQRAEIFEQIKGYFTNNVLDGADLDLEGTTPLLEWGVINSLEIVRLIEFLSRTFDLEIPIDKMVADHFESLNAITDLVLSLQSVQGEKVDHLS